MNLAAQFDHPTHVQLEIKPGALGVVLYDGQCGFCSRVVKRWEKALARNGLEVASLDEAWVAQKIKRPHRELISDIRLLKATGELVSGADVYLYVARRIWWTWPFYAVFSMPGFKQIMRAGYGWFARHRYAFSSVCRLDR